MADNRPVLDFNEASRLAKSLMTIGHPFSPDVVEATACDLVTWCRGAIVDGVIWTPEQQAFAIVNEARTTWDGWPERGGTRQLYQLFRSKFPVREPSAEERLKGALERGLLAAPCEFCRPGDEYCEFGGARRHKRELDEQAAALAARHELTPPEPDEQRLTVSREKLEQMIADAVRVRREEQARKKAQLDDLGVN